MRLVWKKNLKKDSFLKDSFFSEKHLLIQRQIEQLLGSNIDIVGPFL